MIVIPPKHSLQVMTVMISTDGLVVSAPLVLMPQLKKSIDADDSENLRKLQSAEQRLAAPTVLHRLKPSAAQKDLSSAEKSSTRTKLLGLNGSLGHLLCYQFADSLPPVMLRPRCHGETREYLEQEGLRLPYLYNRDDKSAVWQCSAVAGFKRTIRLSTLSDEGDIGATFQLADSGVAIFPHRDCSHKLHREEILSAAAVPQVQLAKRQMMLVLKYAKGPYKSSSFGRRLLEARQSLSSLPENHVLLEWVAPNIIQERQLSKDCSMAEVKQEVLKVVASEALGGDHKASRWGDFVDHFGQLRSRWSIELLVHLVALVLEGRNPLKELGLALAKEGAVDDLALLPKVLRVP